MNASDSCKLACEIAIGDPPVKDTAAEAFNVPEARLADAKTTLLCVAVVST